MTRILIVADTPLTKGAEWELTKMLNEAGIFSDFFITSAVKYQTNTDALIAIRRKDQTANHVHFQKHWVDQSVPTIAAHLADEIRAHSPQIVVVLGDLGLLCLCGEIGVATWRGSTMESTYLPGCKVLVTMSPSVLFKQWHLRPILCQDLRRTARESLIEGYHPPVRQLVVMPVLQQVQAVFETLFTQLEAGPTSLAVDIETSAFHIACIGIAWSATEAICVPFVSKNQNYWNEADEVIVAQLLQKLLTHPNARIIGQNFIFDAQYIHRSWHYIPNFARDTMTAQHVCFPGMSKSLDFIASMYAEHYRYWKLDSFDKVTDAILWEYNCIDCCYTFEVDSVLQQVVDGMQLREPHDFQQSLFWPVLRTMIRGVRYDVENSGRVIKELRQAKEEVQAWLDDIAGHPLNVASSKQMQEFFYEDLGMDEIRKRKTGAVSLDAEALEKLAAKEPILIPILNKVEELRSINMFLSTFLGQKKGKWISTLLDYDERIRCSYNTSGTKTFRFTSSESAFGHGMGLQCIPKGDE